MKLGKGKLAQKIGVFINIYTWCSSCYSYSYLIHSFISHFKTIQIYVTTLPWNNISLHPVIHIFTSHFSFLYDFISFIEQWPLQKGFYDSFMSL